MHEPWLHELLERNRVRVLTTRLKLFLHIVSINAISEAIMQSSMTPYELYLRETLQQEKGELDKLYTEFAHADPLRKRILKTQIDIAMQNMKQVTYDLEKYQSALSYLIETSKERDEMSEKLGEIDEKALQGETQPAVAKSTSPAAAKPAPSAPASRPTIGKPVGSAPAPLPATPSSVPPSGSNQPAARPRIGQPVGTPVAKPESQAPQSQQVPAPSRPTVGTPAARPTIGTPVGRPTIGTPIGRPTIGTPIAKPANQESQPTTPAKKVEEKKEDGESQASDSSGSNS